MTNAMKWIILIIATALIQIGVLRVKGHWIFGGNVAFPFLIAILLWYMPKRAKEFMGSCKQGQFKRTGGCVLGVLKKAKKKKIRKEIIEKAVTTKEIFKDENRKSKIMIMMSLSNLCKSYRNYFKIPKITDKNLENGDTKIEKITEVQTLWCTFELEDIVQRSFRALTRLINEFEFEDLHNPEQTVIRDFKNEFIIVHFRKIYEQELEKIKSKFKIYSKTRYNTTENALHQMFIIFAYYKIFKREVEQRKFSKITGMYLKTLITKTNKKFSEIEEVIKEGEKENFEKDMLELLKFEEAGFKIKWAGYSRKQALKLRSRAQIKEMKQNDNQEEKNNEYLRKNK